MKPRRLWSAAAAACAALLLAAAALAQSGWLRERLRQEAVRAVGSATGSAASLARLDIDWLALTVRLEDFTLAGAQREGEEPLLHAPRLTARLSLRPFAASRLELREVRLEAPRVRIYRREDGSTNLPQPPSPRRRAAPLEDLLRLRVGLLDLRRARLQLNDRRVDFDLSMEGFDLGLAYDFRRTRYRVNLAAERTALPWQLHPALTVEAWLGADEVEITQGSARLGDSRVSWSGTVRHLRQPEADLGYHASVLLRDLAVSPVRQGFAVSSGKVSILPGQPPRIEGDLRAEQLAFAGADFQVRRLDAKGRFVLAPDLLRLEPLEIASPYLGWRGTLELKDWRQLAMDGQAEKASLLRLQAVLREPVAALDARLSGPAGVRLRLTPAGPADSEVRAALDVAPVEGALPLDGRVRFLWRQQCACVAFEESSLATPSIRASFRGVLGQSLEAGVYATSLGDVPALLEAVGAGQGPAIPVALDQGAVHGSVLIDGPLDHPRIRGTATATRVVYEEIPFERVQAQFSIDSRHLDVPSFALRQTAGQVSGSLSLGLDGWRPHPQGLVQASLQTDRADLMQLLRLARLSAPLRGVAAGSLRLGGTLSQPHGQLRLALEQAAWSDEALGRVSLEAALDRAGGFRLLAGRNGARLQAEGVWTHPPDDLRHGEVKADVTVTGFRTADFALFRNLALPLDTDVQFTGALQARIAAGAPRLASISGVAATSAIRLGSLELAPLRVEAETAGDRIALRARMDARPAPVEASVWIRMTDPAPATFHLKWPALSVGLVHSLLKEAGQASGDPLPVSGAFDAEIDGRIDLAGMRGLTGKITVPRLELRPAPEGMPPEVPLPQELFLRNSGPLIFDFDEKAVRVRQAQFSALETDLTLSGAYELASPAPWNLEARGTANLAVLGSFYAGLTAGGAGRLRALLRGAAAEPQVSGQMEIVAASFYLRDLPVGLDDVNGTIFFDRNRANIQKLAGVAGGGAAALSGFVGLARGELSFRLQAQLNNVRLRYPEGVSNTVDADLTLTGSSAASLLSGLVTVKRSGFLVTGDAGSLLGGAGGPLPASAAQNEFLRNLQFDVRLRTAADAVFVVSYASDLQLEGDLHLRGSPAKPILLGSIYASRGEVNFFGNRYNISRGEILFYNTAAVAPQIDLDLETRVRGITVYLNVSGPLSRLNITYRSEPPLQSSEILALLTVGRTPAATSGSMVATDRIRSQTVMENSAGSNTLLGTALTAGLNTRTERFFGASRLRIDPSNVGVDALPQARLSIEQSISRDVTLTFITNLNRSQQQVVRLEWDLSRQWSVIAIKDENGAFAVDFLFRKRFR